MAESVRILHIADSHIGLDLPRRPRHARPRRGDDLVDSHRRTVQLGLARGVDLAIHAGDLFDSPRPTAGAIAAAAGPLRLLADAGILVVIVPGNHERTALSEALALVHPNIHVVDSPRTIALRVRGLRVALTAFPCVRRNVASKFATTLDATDWRQTPADIRVLAVHQAFDSAVCGPNGYRFRSGDDVIDRTMVPVDFDYVAAGHIHRHQKLKPAVRLRPHIVYAGSADRISFAEKDEPKGAVIAEVGPANVSHEFVEHAVRPMSVHPLAVNGLSRRSIADSVERIVSLLPLNAVAQIRLTGAAGPDVLRGLGLAELAHRLRPDTIVSATIRGIETNAELSSEAGDKSTGVFDTMTARRIYAAGVGNVSSLPARCGVYAFFDASARVLYVGKSANLRSRVRAHVSESTSGNFFDGWVRQATRVEAVLAKDDDAATALERSLIHRLRPPFNIVGRLTAG